MPACALRYCRNKTSVQTKAKFGISYHRFPKNEAREKWITFVQKERSEPFWQPNVNSVICSKHLRPEDFQLTKKGRMWLKDTAVPCADPKVPKRENDSDGSIDPLEDVEVSDSEPIFDSVSVLALRKQIQTAKSSKQELSRKLAKLKRNQTAIKKRNKILKNILQEYKSKFPSENEHNFSQDNTVVQTYINTLKILKKPDTKLRYPPSVRKFALTMNYYSGAAYRLLRKAFNNALPSPRTLYYWYGSPKAEPGFTDEAFKALELKSSTEKPLICSLAIGEVRIRHKKMYKNKTVAHVDIGTGPQDEKAIKVLVFMIVALKDSWKIPVGYFQIASITAENKVALIRACLNKCHKVGVRVLNLTMNGGRINFAAVETLGCRLSDVVNMKTHFPHPVTSENVYVFVDPCNVIKSIRKTFEEKKNFTDENNEKVRWQLLINLNRLQQNECLRFDYCKDMHFRNLIMKIKMVTQLLSMSVVRALALAKDFDKHQFAEFSGTSNFVTLLNNFFDVLNSQNCHFYGYKCPIEPDNKEMIFRLLDKVKKYILSLQYVVKRNTLKRRKLDSRAALPTLAKNVVDLPGDNGFVGAIICIESYKNLYEEVVERSGIMPHLAAHRLSLDHLELFFGCIRKHGTKNPNILQVRAAYKKTLDHLTMKSSPTSCIPIDNFATSSAASTDVINTTSLRCRHDDDFQILPNTDDVFDTDIQASVNCEIFAEQLNIEILKETSNLMVGYISGFVTIKLAKELKCEECVNSLMSNKKLLHHKFVTLKDMGGLCYSTESVFKVCLETEAVIKSLIRENLGKPLPSKLSDPNFITAKTLAAFLHSDVFHSLIFHSTQQPCTFNHRIHLIRAIIAKYSGVRLHHQAKADPDLPFTVKRTKLKYFTKLSLF